MVASYLEGSDLQNLSEVSLKCKVAALRVKNEQENQKAKKSLKALQNLDPEQLDRVTTVIDLYQEILFELENALGVTVQGSITIAFELSYFFRTKETVLPLMAKAEPIVFLIFSIT